MTKSSLIDHFNKGLANCYPMTPSDYKELVIKPEAYNKYVFGAITMQELSEIRTYFNY